MARGTVDMWKSKKWVEVIAPKMFNSRNIGYTVATEPKKVIGRRLSVNLGELTGDYNSRQRVMVNFKIDKLSGEQAHTKFMGHTIPQDYMKNVARKRNSKVYVKQEVRTRDDKEFVVKIIIVMDRSSTRSARTQIRATAIKILRREARSTKFSDFISGVLGNRLSILMKKELHTIYPVKHIVIEKTEIDDSVQLPDEPVARNRSRRREGLQKDYHKKASEAGKPKEKAPEKKAEKEEVKAEKKEEVKEKPEKEEKPEKKEKKEDNVQA